MKRIMRPARWLIGALLALTTLIPLAAFFGVERARDLIRPFGVLGGLLLTPVPLFLVLAASLATLAVLRVVDVSRGEPVARLGGVVQRLVDGEVVDFCPRHHLKLGARIENHSYVAAIEEGLHIIPRGLDGQQWVQWWCDGDGGHEIPTTAEDIYVAEIHERARRWIEGAAHTRRRWIVF